jgi:biopolymer transport protein TolR
MHMTRAATLRSEINVTPLVDVCLVLLIIFMVVTPMMINGMPVHLPTSTTATNAGAGPLQVTINGDRTLYIGEDVIRAEDLSSELQRLRAKSNRPIIVRAEKSLPYGDVVKVLDACRKAGFDELGLGAEKP